MDSTQNQPYYLSHSRYTQHLMQSQQKCMVKQHPSALKELLQKPPQQCHSKTSLSPDGTFKYIKRQNAKAYYNNYSSVVLKPPIFTSQERIRRPLNCFMVFSHLERRKVAEEHPELHNADLSKILGRRWKTLTPLEKQPYIDEAERIRQLHTEIYPDYKYQPRRKNQIKRNGRKSEDDEETSLQQDEDEKTESDQSSLKEPSEKMKKNEHQKEEQVKDSQTFSAVNTVATRTTTSTTAQDLQLQCYQNKLPKYHQIQNSSFHLLTPAASPYYGTQDSSYNQNIQEGHIAQDGGAMNDPLRSFPPTPEVSPIMLNREESAFAFDFSHYIPPVLQQQSQHNMSMLRNIRPQSQSIASADLTTCQLQQQQQQHVNEQMCYQNYYPMDGMDYYYGNGTSYHQNYVAHQHAQQQGGMQTNLHKNEMTNSFTNILDSLQNH